MERLRLIADCGLRIANCFLSQPCNPKSEIRNPKSVAGIALFTLFALWLTLSVPAMVMACPLCKEALFDPGQLHQRLATARGYALSIGLMLLVPLGLIAGLAVWIVRATRRKSVEWIEDIRS